MSKYGDVQQALDAAEMETARELLRDYLEAEPDSAEVWYLAAQAAVNDKQRRYFLEKAVDCDPLHAAAGNALHDMIQAEAATHQPQAEVQSQVQSQPAAQSQPQVDYAPILNRGLAFLIDLGFLFILSNLTRGLAFLLMGTPESSSGLAQVFMVWMMFNTIAYVFYYGYSFTAGQGQTIGKRWTGIRVVKANGTNLTWADAFLRCWIGYILSAAPLGLGFVWATIDKDKRGWHDMIAETRVIKA